MVAGNARRREDVAEQRERLVRSQTLLRDRVTGCGGELARAARRIERRRRQTDAMQHVVQNLLGQPLSLVVEAVKWSFAHVTSLHHAAPAA